MAHHLHIYVSLLWAVNFIMGNVNIHMGILVWSYVCEKLVADVA